MQCFVTLPYAQNLTITKLHSLVCKIYRFNHIALIYRSPSEPCQVITRRNLYGFSLQAADPPAMDRFEKDLDAVERSHLQYLGVGNMMQLARPEFAEKLVRALLARVRSIFETALGEIELWNKSTSGQLDAQLRERRRAYGRRIEAIQRIQDAAGGLDLRLGEIGEQEAALDAVTQRLQSMSHELLAARADAGARAEAAEAVAV